MAAGENAKTLADTFKGPRRVLLVTDIGRDVDDTLALLTINALRQAGDLDLVGVIATGGAGETRARVVRGWLRRFGLSDSIVPVAACRAPGRPECAVPEATPGPGEAALYEGSAEDLLVELAQIYAGSLEIMAIAPLSSIAATIRSDRGLQIVRQGVRALYIQGQCELQEGRLKPDFASFNLDEDREASEIVCMKLQDHMPFHFLGKHAAYQVSLLRSDFAAWDAMLGSEEMTRHAKDNLDVFRRGSPDKFYAIYPIPEGYRNDSEWFEHMTEFSHPYDPLLVLSAFHADLFGQVASSAPDGPQEHTTIGNTPASPGVPDPQAVRKAICKLIGEGVQGLIHA